MCYLITFARQGLLLDTSNIILMLIASSIKPNTQNQNLQHQESKSMYW
jgi:hypothetical protein